MVLTNAENINYDDENDDDDNLHDFLFDLSTDDDQELPETR